MEANKRLKQTQHHLNNLKRIERKQNLYMFDLINFIQSARTVTWYLQKEFKNCSEFDVWYTKKQQELNSDPICKFIHNKERRFIVHEGYPKFKRVKFGKFYYIGPSGDLRGGEYMTSLDNKPMEFVTPGDSVTIFVSGGKVKASDKYLKDSKYKVNRYFVEFPKINIIDLCENYLNKIKLICNEWEKIIQRKTRK